MEEAKKRALSKELSEFTHKELLFLGKLCIKYDVSLTDMLGVVCEGHKEMLRMAKEFDEKLNDRPEIVEE